MSTPQSRWLIRCDSDSNGSDWRARPYARLHNMNARVRACTVSAVNTILEKISCKRKRRPYIRSHRAMLRTKGHTESRETRFGVLVAIYLCAFAQGSSPKLPRNLDWRNAGP